MAAQITMKAEPGRKFICMGPHCWGAATSAAQAIKNAKKNRVTIYEGRRGWCYILFDCREDVWVDEMGAFCWKNRWEKSDDAQLPYREVLRYNMPKTKESK